MSIATQAAPATATDLSRARLHLLRAGYLLMGVGLAMVKWPLLPDAHALPLYEGVTLCLLTAMSLLAFLELRTRSCLPPGDKQLVDGTQRVVSVCGRVSLESEGQVLESTHPGVEERSWHHLDDVPATGREAGQGVPEAVGTEVAHDQTEVQRRVSDGTVRPVDDAGYPTWGPGDEHMLSTEVAVSQVEAGG